MHHDAHLPVCLFLLSRSLFQSASCAVRFRWYTCPMIQTMRASQSALSDLDRECLGPLEYS